MCGVLTDSFLIQHRQLDEFAFIEGSELSHVVVKSDEKQEKWCTEYFIIYS